jgi:hypothetical protein
MKCSQIPLDGQVTFFDQRELLQVRAAKKCHRPSLGHIHHLTGIESVPYVLPLT